MKVEDVPRPSLLPGMVLIENKYSLISSGTERSTVKVGKANLLGKAKQRPDLVAQVLQNIKSEGLGETIHKVRNKLNSTKALGYCSAGIVLASKDKNGEFRPGDRVACAGQDYASHAEIIAVPQNLVVRIPENVSLEESAFTTAGAIALQGVRQSEPKLGEKICVIGLGLLGQLTGQLLKSNGCEVFGIDLSDRLVEMATGTSTDIALLRHDPNLINACDGFTNGYGFDHIIIATATNSNDPVVLATEIARKKGKIIVLGTAKMEIPRDPYFYKKELELKISCSYGPGRYDPDYEEGGIDYPYAYVRWTEKRNMEAFLTLASKGLLKLDGLISHRFEINDAVQAYEVVLGEKPEFHLGMILRYPGDEKKFSTLVHVKNHTIKKINVGFVGGGSFAQNHLIPNVKGYGASLDTVVTSKGLTAKNVGVKFGFSHCSTDINDIVENKEINTLFIATPHSYHAEQVILGLRSGKNIFVEKPLAINYDQLIAISKTKSNHDFPLMVGFNRRFAPISQKIKGHFKSVSDPLIINIRINAGYIPKEHWIQNAGIGGGRIIGEICHFVDLMQFFTDSDPVNVFADCIQSKNSKIQDADNIIILVKFKNGSVGNIIYTANGDKSLPKEYIEVFGGGKAGIINDFRMGTIHHVECSQKPGCIQERTG